MDELNSKKDELRAAHRLQQRRFNDFKRTGQENIRHLALLTRTVVDRLDDMIKKRETLLRCVERCRKNEMDSEIIDPFLYHWKLESSQKAELSQENKSKAVLPNGIDLGGYAFIPSKIDHHLICECDPCTCEVQTEEIDQSGLNAPISKVNYAHEIIKIIIRYNCKRYLSYHVCNFVHFIIVHLGILRLGEILDSFKSCQFGKTSSNRL